MGRRIKDITGLRHGKLVALYNTMKKTSGGTFIWRCRCDCGKEIDVALGNLKNGHTTSCGCSRQNNIKGKKFYKLKAIRNTGKTKNETYIWEFLCECGKTVLAKASNVTRGRTRSCGCLSIQHGMSRSDEYYIYNGCKERCNNPKTSCYDYYGGRGIKFLFKNFDEFYKELGPRPSKNHSVDRIDTNGNYEKGNVRWATSDIQNQNQRTTKLDKNSVIDIRNRYTESNKDALASEYNVDETTIRDVVSRKTWKNIK